MDNLSLHFVNVIMSKKGSGCGGKSKTKVSHVLYLDHFKRKPVLYLYLKVAPISQKI